MRKVTSPDTLAANGLWNWFTGRKRWRITCGECKHTWDEKVPICEICSALCPCCGAQNRWNPALFEVAYRDYLKQANME